MSAGYRPSSSPAACGKRPVASATATGRRSVCSRNASTIRSGLILHSAVPEAPHTLADGLDSGVPIPVSEYTGTTRPDQCDYSSVWYKVKSYNSGIGGTSEYIYFRGDPSGGGQFGCP